MICVIYITIFDLLCLSNCFTISSFISLHANNILFTSPSSSVRSFFSSLCYSSLSVLVLSVLFISFSLTISHFCVHLSPLSSTDLSSLDLYLLLIFLCHIITFVAIAPLNLVFTLRFVLNLPSLLPVVCQLRTTCVQGLC